MRAPLTALACGLLLAGDARADGTRLEPTGARAVGRAGIGAVSDDGGAALLVNPAAIARRALTRVRIGVILRDADASYRTDRVDGAPELEGRGGATALPDLSGCTALARTVVVCIGYLETADVDHQLPKPELDQPVDEVRRLFPHRYGGLRFRHLRRTLAAGASVRANEWLGVGASVSLSRVTLIERRHLWAGFDSVAPVGDPTRDLSLRLEASGLSPGAAAGVFVAPLSPPIEIGAAVRASLPPELDGEAAVAHTRSTPFPDAEPPLGTAALSLPATVAAHTGLRYLGDRVLAEVGGTLVVHPGAARRRWAIDGITIVDGGGDRAALESVPALASARDHGSLGGAVDVEVLRGFVWLTAAYRWRTAATPRRHTSPVAADLGGHTVAAGAEVQWGTTTLTVGYARTLERTLRLGSTEVPIVNPFGAGSGDAASGRHTRGGDAFGVTLDVGWD